MIEMLGTNGAKFIVASLVVALALLCLVGVFWFIRNRPSSAFIRGGKNRQPRLAVLDAAAVDTRRRLVLVRRDDVEHLIMIGGPTDIVIESGIAPPRASAPALQEPVLPQQAVERRAVQPAQNRPAPDAKAVPVSAMANVLYGESSAKPVDQPRSVATPAQVRIREEASSQRPTPVERVSPQPVGSREKTAMVNAADTLFPPSKAPEDILDAARNRVLAPGGSTQTPVQNRPVQASVAMVPQQAGPQQAGGKPLADFESFLDAEITGNLQGLTPTSAVRAEQVSRPVGAAGRQEPNLDGPAGRQEPTLEQEMNRMLSEIDGNRKP